MKYIFAVTIPQFDTLLAALRLRQHVIELPRLPGRMKSAMIEDIATRGDEHAALNPSEIEELCDYLNCTPKSHNIHGNLMDLSGKISALADAKNSAARTHILADMQRIVDSTLKIMSGGDE